MEKFKDLVNIVDFTLKQKASDVDIRGKMGQKMDKSVDDPAVEFLARFFRNQKKD